MSGNASVGQVSILSLSLQLTVQLSTGQNHMDQTNFEVELLQSFLPVNRKGECEFLGLVGRCLLKGPSSSTS